ncbi:MAG: FAD:protein transferase [Acidimicrobiaceae bacterium]|nr:FAD:protein transferase [Acidimicrobiaceae bacterium]
MGSDAHVIVVGDPALLEEAVARIEDLEQRWSRFLPDSEVTRLSRQSGSPVHVSAETTELVQRAKEGWAMSGGLFDPTVLGDVVRAGYDRTFDLLASEPSHDRPTSALRLGAEDIEVTADIVRLPPSTGFDPGGIGKGLAADIVVAELLAAGATGACVSLGGDVRVGGDGIGAHADAADRGWTVAIEHAHHAEPVALIGLADGAVATSTTLVRRWQSVDGTRHHLIDPHTGLPSDTDLTHATVVAGQAWAAEVLAKAVLLRGSLHPFDILGPGLGQALVVSKDGRVQATPGLAAYLGGAALPTRLPTRLPARPATPLPTGAG